MHSAITERYIDARGSITEDNMSRIDYSKWNHIEVSDDEDETHPNVDTPSLFRMRHKARVRRMEKAKEEREDMERGKNENSNKLQEMKQVLEKLETEGASESILSGVSAEVNQLEEDERKWRAKEEEIAKKERLTPWNVDTLSQDGFEKTLINKYEEEEDATKTDLKQRENEFTEKYEHEMKEFGMYSGLGESERFLLGHPHLASEFTAQFLAAWCLDLEDQGKSSLVEQVAHQTLLMQYLLELAKTMKTDPRACIRPFFLKMAKAEEQNQSSFREELDAFKDRIRKTAKDRQRLIQKLADEKVEEERRSRLGPGGLDPVEVMKSLPEEIRNCFETQDVPLLQERLSQMSFEEAKCHMDRCEKAGIWRPSVEQNGARAANGGSSEDNNI